LAEGNGIRAVELTLVSRNSHGASSGAVQSDSSPHNLKLSLQARAATLGGQAVSGVVDGSGLGGDVTSETFAALSSSKDLHGREGNVINTAGVLAVELVLGNIDLSDSDKTVGFAVATTVIDVSASKTSASAVFRIVIGVNIVSIETAACTLTIEVSFGIAVVRNVPASSFKETEGDFGDLGTNGTTVSHDVQLVESSFNVSTSVLFHEETRNSGASIVVSESFSQRRKIQDSLVHSLDSHSLDVVGQNVTFRVQEILIERSVHTEGMDKLVSQGVDVKIVDQGVSIGVGDLNLVDIEANVHNNGSLDTSGHGTESGGHDPA